MECGCGTAVVTKVHGNKNWWLPFYRIFEIKDSFWGSIERELKFNVGIMKILR